MSCPSSCATRSHMVTPVPLLELPVSRISNYTRNPRTEVDAMSLRVVTAYGRSHTERFYPLVISETFTLVPFRFLVPVLQIYIYLVLLTVTPLKLHYQVTYSHTGALIRISSFPYFQLHSESPDRSGYDESERSYCLWKEPY